MVTKRQRPERSKGARARGSDTEAPEWLSAQIDKELIHKELIDKELSAPRGIAEVAEHFSTMSDKPLPGDLLPVLLKWLVEHHGLKITQGRRGAPPTPLREWYPLIDRLVGLGLPIKEACQKVIEHEGLKNDLDNMARQYRRDRSIEAKLADEYAGAILREDKAGAAKALAELRGRTERAD